jgi:hypothetical protein
MLLAGGNCPFGKPRFALWSNGWRSAVFVWQLARLAHSVALNVFRERRGPMPGDDETTDDSVIADVRNFYKSEEMH